MSGREHGTAIREMRLRIISYFAAGTPHMDLNYLHPATSACRLSEQTHTPHAAAGTSGESAFSAAAQREKRLSCNILFAIKRPALLFLGARVQKAESGALTASSGTHTYFSLILLHPESVLRPLCHISALCRESSIPKCH
jgi:hypothetical protein